MLARIVVALSLIGCARSTPPPAAPCPVPVEKPFAMRSYTLVMLKRGPAWTPEKTDETTRLFEGHMANIKAMARSGKLVLAGPLDAPDTDRTAYAGIFIFDPTDPAEVQRLLAADPSIAAGRLVAELRTWYGPVGLTFDGVSESLND